jgi:hypothetical protein
MANVGVEAIAVIRPGRPPPFLDSRESLKAAIRM